MSTTKTSFDLVQESLQKDGVDGALQTLADEFRQQKRYHELFEALKMQARHRLGLPLRYSDSGDELDESVRNQLEDGLIAACREVGLLILEEGRVREGWMYLRPVGDRDAAAELIRKVEVNDENLDEVIEVSLHEGVDVERGYSLVLEHFGTCNAITLYESTIAQQPNVASQKSAARLLLRHLYQELTSALKADIEQQQGKAPQETTLHGLVADRDWLFGEHSYHVDTTHLASTVRFARILDDSESLELAVDLTEYGRRLSQQFQYQGEEPFADIYPSHALYFKALLGREVDEAIAYFREKAESVDEHQYGTVAIETYIDLLSRVGRYEQAIDEAIQRLPSDQPTMGIAPTLLDLALDSNDPEQRKKVVDFCRQSNDLLGYSVGLME